MTFGSHPLEYTSVPTVNPGVGGTDARERISTDAGMFGGAIAQGLETFGVGLEKAANTGLQIASEHQEKQNEVHAAEVGTWLADRVTDRHAQYATLEGKAALEDLPKYKQDLEDLYKQAMEQAPSESERAMVAKSGRYLTSQFYRYATVHATSQSRAWADKTAVDRAGNNANLGVDRQSKQRSARHGRCPARFGR
ncbi:hypothetical protein ACVWXN_002699 [Bradyrhizobium sp. i1.4.4]